MRSILIADSHTLCREALCAYIRHAEPEFAIGEAETLQGLQACIQGGMPDIVLVEKNLPDLEAATIRDFASHAGTKIGLIVADMSDTGEGIEADILPNIFDPFFSTKTDKKGAGLGLSTVQGIVTAGGGALVIETTHGQGTHAHVFLPRHIQKIQPMVA